MLIAEQVGLPAQRANALAMLALIEALLGAHADTSTHLEAARRLTTQERQIAFHAAEGLTNRQIAARLFLSPKTVEYHLGNIYRKLGLRSRLDLIRHVSSPPAADAG